MRPQRHHRAHHRLVLGARHQPGPGPQALRHRLLEQEPGLLPEPVARLQLGPRPHAVGGDRGRRGQPEDDCHRGQRRRRYRRDRHRPVRAPDAPQPPDGLHHRGQRLLRPDQGAVLSHGRSRIEAEDRASSTTCLRSIPARWRSSWGRRSSRGRSRATRNSSRRSSRRRSVTAARR